VTEERKECIICDHPVPLREITSCPVCKLPDVCVFCLFPIEGLGMDAKQCVACCIPMCYECDWYEGSSKNLSDERKLIEKDRGYKTEYSCPRTTATDKKCRSRRIMAIEGGFRAPKRFYAKHNQRRQWVQPVQERTLPPVNDQEKERLKPFDEALSDLDLNP